MNQILVVAAHPDDEVLGCGGMILRHVSLGDSVDIAILGEGQTARTIPKRKKKRSLLSLHHDARRVSRFLGVHKLHLVNLPDNRFDSVDFLTIVKQVELIKNQIHPDIVYTHHYGDLNIDHRITCQAVVTAFRPQPEEKRTHLFSFETVSSTEWNIPTTDAVFKPNYFVPLSEMEIKAKIQAFGFYRTEIRDYPHPRSSAALINLAAWRGNSIGKAFAEAFEVLRIIAEDPEEATS